MHVAFPKETFDKLVTYLGDKPFNEVENLINELKATVKPINILTPEPPKEGVDAEHVPQAPNDSAEQAANPETTTEGENNQA